MEKQFFGAPKGFAFFGKMEINGTVPEQVSTKHLNLHHSAFKLDVFT